MGIEEVFIDPCPGCEDVVPGIVTPGGPPSPPLTRRWGGIQKKTKQKKESALDIIKFAPPSIDSYRYMYRRYIVEEESPAHPIYIKIVLLNRNITQMLNITFRPRQFKKRPHWSQHWAPSCFFRMPPHRRVNGGLGDPPGVTIPGTTCSHPGQ